MADELTPAQDRAVRLALVAAHYRARAERAEATIARVQALHDHWVNWHKLGAEDLRLALTDNTKDQP